MGLFVEILAVGPFRREAADILQYPPEFYASTRDGSTVIVDLFGIMEGTHAGELFAAAFGIPHVWGRVDYKIDPDQVNVANLRSLLPSLGDHERYLYDLERFERLRDLGFDFYLLPNG